MIKSLGSPRKKSPRPAAALLLFNLSLGFKFTATLLFGKNDFQRLESIRVDGPPSIEEVSHLIPLGLGDLNLLRSKKQINHGELGHQERPLHSSIPDDQITTLHPSLNSIVRDDDLLDSLYMSTHTSHWAPPADRNGYLAASHGNRDGESRLGFIYEDGWGGREPPHNHASLVPGRSKDPNLVNSQVPSDNRPTPLQPATNYARAQPSFEPLPMDPSEFVSRIEPNQEQRLGLSNKGALERKRTWNQHSDQPRKYTAVAGLTVSNEGMMMEPKQRKKVRVKESPLRTMQGLNGFMYFLRNIRTSYKAFSQTEKNPKKWCTHVRTFISKKYFTEIQPERFRESPGAAVVEPYLALSQVYFEHLPTLADFREFKKVLQDACLNPEGQTPAESEQLYIERAHYFEWIQEITGAIFLYRTCLKTIFGSEETKEEKITHERETWEFLKGVFQNFWIKRLKLQYVPEESVNGAASTEIYRRLLKAFEKGNQIRKKQRSLSWYLFAYTVARNTDLDFFWMDTFDQEEISSKIKAFIYNLILHYESMTETALSVY